MKNECNLYARWTICILINIAILCAILAVIRTDIFGRKGNGLGREFQYDINRLRETDPTKILYEETGLRFRPDILDTHAIAIGSDDILYVGGGRQISAYTLDGQSPVNTITLEQDLSALTVSDNGSLYVGLRDHIEVFDKTGSRISRWESSNPKTILISIAIHKQDVFATDFANREIIHWDSLGHKKQTFGEFTIPSPYFDLAVSADNILYVAHTGEHRIESFDFEGNLLSWFGEFSFNDPSGFCGCCNPVNFALLPNREGFVTCEKGITRVKVHDMDGKFMGFVAGPDRFSHHDNLCSAPDSDITKIGLDVAVDSKGLIYILDSVVKEIRAFGKI